jgi:hypothetical protein
MTAIGTFGTDYLRRAAIAYFGPGARKPEALNETRKPPLVVRAD